MFSYKLIRTTEEWERIKEPWNDLLSRSITHVPFLRYEFLRQWWDTRGGGEWSKGELCIITAYQDEELVGIAPFFCVPGKKSDLMFIGSFEITDYLDFIVAPSDLEEFLSGLFKYLNDSDLLRFHELDLYNILDYSPSIPALEETAAQYGWQTRSEVLQKAPYISLPGDWETYLQSIDKKQRHEIRRKMRRLADSGLAHRWYVVEDNDTIDAAIASFLELMANDVEKKSFLTPAMRIQMEETMRCAFETGCLHLSFLEIEGKKAAGYFSFNYLNRLWVYNSGLDPQFSVYSPGWVLLGHLLKMANEQKFEEFDFLRGDEDYKYKFGAKDRKVIRLQVLHES